VPVILLSPRIANGSLQSDISLSPTSNQAKLLGEPPSIGRSPVSHRDTRASWEIRIDTRNVIVPSRTARNLCGMRVEVMD
jgi:hypothetical protein